VKIGEATRIDDRCFHPANPDHRVEPTKDGGYCVFDPGGVQIGAVARENSGTWCFAGAIAGAGSFASPLAALVALFDELWKRVDKIAVNRNPRPKVANGRRK
jgi:hypothetical protein